MVWTTATEDASWRSSTRHDARTSCRTGPPTANGEVREIVRRASEIEATSPTADGSLTIGGVQEIAEEVGIPTTAVRQAARALDAPSARSTPSAPAPAAAAPVKEGSAARFWLGGPTRVAYERIVDGELPESEFPILVDEIRRMVNHQGQVSQLGRSFSWTSARTGSTRNVEVAVSVRGGQTRISVRENLGALIGGVFGGIGGGMGGGGLGPLFGIVAGGLGAPAAAFAVLPLWFAATFAVARSTFYYAVRRRQRELEPLADRLAELTRELTPKRPALGGGSRPLLP